MKKDTLLIVLGLAVAGVLLYMMLNKKVANPLAATGLTPAYGGGGPVSPYGYSFATGFTPVPNVNPTVAAVGAGVSLGGAITSLFTGSVPPGASVPTLVGDRKSVV